MTWKHDYEHVSPTSRWFDISTNAVEGTIPDSMGNLLFLQFVVLGS
jgi:hypothetical protein